MAARHRILTPKHDHTTFDIQIGKIEFICVIGASSLSLNLRRSISQSFFQGTDESEIAKSTTDNPSGHDTKSKTAPFSVFDSFFERDVGQHVEV